jgi:hypothetical protein
MISIPIILYSQEQKKSENEYYKDLSDSLLVKPYLAYTAADYSIYYNNANSRSEMIKYNTLEKEVNGITLSWKDFGISAGVGRVTAPEYKDEAGKNKLSYDFRINYLGRKIGYDLYFLKQDGLFLKNREKNPDGTLPYYSSMDFTIASANLYYIFSCETFSLRAAYDSIDRQLKSAGSFLIMMSSGVIRVSDDSSMLREESNSVEEKMKGLKECRTEYVSISPGYSRTFVFFDNFFFNFLLFCGIGADRTVYAVDSGEIAEKELFLRANSKFALGYSGDKFFCGASLNLDVQKISMERGISTSAGFYDSKFYAGYRFSMQ